MGLLSMLRVGDRGPATRRHRRAFTSSFLTGVESLESRIVLSHAAAEVAAPAAAAVNNNFVISGVQLTNFQVVDNVLHAAGTVTGTLAGLPFTANITDFALNLIPDNTATPAVECSVLHLALAPIHLSLLGLHVDTSPICLDITATEGGGLLGDLLCSLAGGDNLLGIPTLPTVGQLNDLTSGLTQILNGALNGQAAQPSGDDSVCTGDCHVLALSLGPVELSLLGLNVSLDDCNGGPVQVCVSATRSEGLLGSLLCSLSGAQGQGINLDLADITQLSTRALSLLADGTLSGRDVGTLTSLFGRLIR